MLGTIGEAILRVHGAPPRLTPVPDGRQPRQPPPQQQHGLRGRGHDQGHTPACRWSHGLCECKLGSRIQLRQTVHHQPASQ